MAAREAPSAEPAAPRTSSVQSESHHHASRPVRILLLLPADRMTNYRKGQRAEWRARDLLKQQGYHTVIRAAGSKGHFDLIGLGPKDIALVQVKRGRAISKSERAELLELKQQLPDAVTVEIWTFDAGERLPEVEVL